MYNLENRKLGFHLVAYDANNPSGMLLGMMSAVILTDVWAHGGKVVWGQGAYTRPEARRYNIMVKLMFTLIQLCKKNNEVLKLRGWTNNAHFVDLTSSKIEISKVDTSKLFYAADIGKPNSMRTSPKL